MGKLFKTMIKTALNHVKTDPESRAEKPEKRPIPPITAVNTPFR